jgi:hypothetical protein
MKHSHKLSITQINDLLKVGIEFQIEDNSQGYKWLEELLIFHHYHKLSKKDKGIIIKYASIVLCLSVDRTKKLCSIWQNTSKIVRKKYKRVRSHNKYTSDDIAIVYETRDLHRINGNAIKKILIDEFEIYHNPLYANIKDISVSYIYMLLGKNSHNLRGTYSLQSAIGTRQALTKDDKPGHISIDIEMKNGYIIRKHFGFLYIPKEYSDKFNIYLETYFNSYLNFHRSSGYLTGIHKSNKVRSVREYDYYNTPSLF